MSQDAGIDLEKFRGELIALCERHGVQLTISMDGDLEVWPEEPGDRALSFGLVAMALPEDRQ